MDAETARELVALIDSKINRLQRSQQEILDLVAKGKGQPSSPVVGAASKLDGASETTRQIYEVMLSMNRIVSPKELFEELKNRGHSLPDVRVRQILMRWKGRLFESPKRGSWKAIKEEQ